MNQLTPQMAKFCWQFASVESDTYNFKAKSAEAAGYKSPGNSATDLLKKPKIQAEIQRLNEANVSKHLPSLLSKAEYVYNDSIKNGDRTNANTATKLQLQACGFLREGFEVEKREKAEITAKDEEIADKFAELRLKYPGRPVTELLQRLLDKPAPAFAETEAENENDLELVGADELVESESI